MAHMHDGLLAVLGSEEVKQVLPVHLDPLQRLAGDLRSACSAHGKQINVVQPRAWTRYSYAQRKRGLCSPSAKRPFGEVATKCFRSMSFL